MTKNSPSRESASKYRRASVVLALVFALASLYTGLSIASSLFGAGFFFAEPGAFFSSAYGVLAFLVPAYLLAAAVILLDPVYRPDRIFVLSAAIAPFLTLALGFAGLRDFDRYASGGFPFSLGRVGFSFAVILLTVLESFLAALLRTLVFGHGRAKEGFPGGKQEKKADTSGDTLRLPPPRTEIKDVYTQAAAKKDGSDRVEEIPPFLRCEKNSHAVHLPELKPLASAAALREMEEAGLLEEITPSGGSLAGSFRERGEEPGADSGETSVDGFIEEPGSDPLGGTDGDLAKAFLDAEEAAAKKAEAERAKEAKTKLNVSGASERSKRKEPYRIPVEGLLTQYPDGEYWIIDQATREAALTLKETLKEFNIQAEVTGIRKGPVITMFEILPAPGVKLSRIVNLQDNIALRLAAASVRIVAPIPGKHAVGIEVPNQKRNIVSFREIIEGELDTRDGKKMEIPVVLGKDITGEAQTIDLVQTPHLLIAGATGSGKSVCVNSMILSILYKMPPSECRMILIDPKIVELKLYNDIPHLLTPVITEPKKAFQALQYCIYEMERRYACLDSMGVRDIRSYNRRIKERHIAAEHMPYIVVVIDEFADLMATTGKELESTVARLAAMSRAVGVHLVLATQRPSIDVITGLIKANIPSRIAFMVASKMDSRIIIDMVGADLLLGKGDMLYAGVVDPFPVRIQGAFVSEEEVERVVEYVKTLGKPEYIDDEIFFDDDDDEISPSLFSDGEDPLYDKALEIVTQQGKASASYIQRRLKIGYNRAARLVEEMEHKGIVGPAQGSKPRELLRGM